MRKFLIGSLTILAALAFTACHKDKGENGDGYGDAPRTAVPAELQGGWLWADGGSVGVFDPNTGVYQGPEIGMAQKYTLNADGTGTVLSYIGSQTDKYYITEKGTYQIDVAQKKITFNTASGTYEKNGAKRSLAGDELYPKAGGIEVFYYNIVTSSGTVYLYKKDDPSATDDDYMHSTRFTKL